MNLTESAKKAITYCADSHHFEDKDKKKKIAVGMNVSEKIEFSHNFLNDRIYMGITSDEEYEVTGGYLLTEIEITEEILQAFKTLFENMEV